MQVVWVGSCDSHTDLGLRGSAEPVQDVGWFHDTLDAPASNLGHGRIDEFQKVVDVANRNPNQIHRNRVAEDGRKGEHDPGEIRRIKVEKAKKDHFHVFVAAAPNVRHGKGQRIPQKVNVGIKAGEPRNTNHAKGQHPNVIGAAVNATEFPIFQQPRVLDKKVHVKEEINGEETKKEKGRYEPPEFTLPNQFVGKVERKGRNQLDRTSCRCEKGACQVKA